MIMNRRTLVSVLAACALSAGVAGGAAAMPDHVDGPVPQTVSADEISLFQNRAHRTDDVCEVPSPGQTALDRAYKAAGYVRTSAGTTTAPAWFDALLTRSDALNQIYWLGAYANLQH
jgi:hypothetical protein